MLGLQLELKMYLYICNLFEFCFYYCLTGSRFIFQNDYKLAINGF